MIKIKYNNEGYEITYSRPFSTVDLAFADYNSSIGEHVDNIYEILTTLGIEVILEDM